MKKLGLIGGTGPESTLIYYKEINRLVNEKYQGKAFPELAIESVNLNYALGLVADRAYDELADYFNALIANLEAGSADYVALTAATMHIIRDKIVTRVPFISIPEVAAEYAANEGYKKVGMIGTIFTMENTYLSEDFAKRGIEVVVPKKDDRILVNELIAKELEYGIVKEESVNELIEVIERMKEENEIQAIILGCTELPLAINPDNSPVPCLDIMKIHIDKLVSLV